MLLGWIWQKFGLVVIGVIIVLIIFVFVFYGVFNLKSIRGLHEGVVGVYRDWETDRKSTRLNSSHEIPSRMPSSA